MGSIRFGRIAFTSTLVFAGVSAFAQAPGLATRAGHEIGVAVSGYKYTESGVMDVKATHAGFDYAGTFKLDEAWFARAGLSYAAGKSDYSGSGTLNDRPQHVYEFSAVLGKDLAMGDTTLSPYVGLGYRQLFHDLRGTTSTGNLGYRRESRYLTLPLGVVHQMRLEQQARLVSTLEYAHLIRGRQESLRSDTGLGLADVTNRQGRGSGWRLAMMYQQKNWSVGPFVTLWHIKDSDWVAGVLEPENKTKEFGVKAAYRF